MDKLLKNRVYETDMQKTGSESQTQTSYKHLETLKDTKNRAKNLMKLGVPRWVAWRTAYANGYAQVCRTGDAHQARDYLNSD